MATQSKPNCEYNVTKGATQSVTICEKNSNNKMRITIKICCCWLRKLSCTINNTKWTVSLTIRLFSHWSRKCYYPILCWLNE